MIIPLICTELSVCQPKGCILSFFTYFNQQLIPIQICEAHYRNVSEQNYKLYQNYKPIFLDLHLYVYAYINILQKLIKNS